MRDIGDFCRLCDWGGKGILPLLQIALKEPLQLVPRNVVSAAAVVEVAVGGVRDNQEFHIYCRILVPLSYIKIKNLIK